MKPKKKNRMLTDLARFGHGFVYAWHGICAAVLEERNFRFHLCVALYVFAAAHMAHIDATGVALLAICVFMMLGMELMNSAVERAVDKPDTTHWWSAGAAKDMAAGGVLVTAFGAVVVGICLFGNAAALNAIWTSVTTTPLSTALWVLSLVLAYLFTFCLGKHVPQFVGIQCHIPCHLIGQEQFSGLFHISHAQNQTQKPVQNIAGMISFI